MSIEHPPKCIRCGHVVYHRKTMPQQWRCQSCSAEFSDDDIKRKREAEQLRWAEFRQQAVENRLAEKARREEEARAFLRAIRESWQLKVFVFWIIFMIIAFTMAYGCS